MNLFSTGVIQISTDSLKHNSLVSSETVKILLIQRRRLIFVKVLDVHRMVFIYNVHQLGHRSTVCLVVQFHLNKS